MFAHLDKIHVRPVSEAKHWTVRDCDGTIQSYVVSDVRITRRAAAISDPVQLYPSIA